MKKILALVLALVMTLSLATISSGAAYSDADSVQYVDAVNMMSTLGVMGGYADGSIRPQADVTRGAAAKMVAMVATGSNPTTIGYYKGTSSFADVPATHTFADAVSFCVARGIVAGYGDGTYGVADNVKGWAVAKMVLVAMGYDAKAFGMEGAGSALNTITLASQKGLFAGMKADFNANEAASREECAQIVYNALNKTGVEKNNMNSDGSYTYKDSTAKLVDKYNTMVKDVVTANAATGAGYTVINGVNYNVETGLDLIGHKVAVVPSSVKKTDAAGYDYYDAFAVVDLSSVVTVAADISNADKFDAAFGKAAIDASGVKMFKDYKEETWAHGFTDGSAAKAGTYVLYTDENGTDLVSALTYDFSVGYVTGFSAGTAKVDGYVKVGGGASVNEKIHTVANNDGYTMVSYYDGIAQDDVVVVQKTGLLTTVIKAETVTGTVSAYDAANYTLTIDGKDYYTSATASGSKFTSTDADLKVTGLLTANDAVSKKVVAYLDATGAVFAMVTAPDATNDAGIVWTVANYTTKAATAYGEATSTFVQCVDMNGKEVSFQVESALTGADLNNLKKVYTYVKNGVTYAAFDGALVNEAIAADVGTDIGAYDVKVASTSNYFASDVKFIYVANSLSDLFVEVKTGVQAVTDAYDYYYTTSATSSNNTVKYVVVNNYASTAVASTDVVFCSANAAVTKCTYTGTDGKLYSCDVYGVYINGEYTNVKVAAGYEPATGFNSYSVDAATGLYSFADYTTDVLEGAVATNLYNGMLTLDSVITDVAASSAKIIDVRYAEAADKTNLVEITTLDGLFYEVAGATAKNATVSVVYEKSAGYPSNIVAIYVTAAPVDHVVTP